MDMVEEIIGLPGCGKTTLINQLKKETSFCTREELVKNLTVRFYLVMHRIPGINVERIFGMREEYNLFQELICRNFPNGIGSDSMRYVYRSLELLYAIKKFKPEKAILDEGVVQFISSIFFKEQIRDVKVLGEMDSCIFSKLGYSFLYYKEDIDICAKRVEERKNKKNRYDMADESERHRMLEVKEMNLEAIINQIDENRVRFVK